LIKIDKIHLDALKEVGNIGEGQAASGLSEFIEEKLIPAPTQVGVLLRDNVISWLDIKEQMVVACFHLLGETSGRLLLVIPMDNMSSLLGHHQQLDHLTKNDLHYLKTIITIVASAYTTNMSIFLSTVLIAYSPSLMVSSPENLKIILAQNIIENTECFLYKIRFNRSPLLTPWTQFGLIFGHEALRIMLGAVDRMK